MLPISISNKGEASPHDQRKTFYTWLFAGVLCTGLACVAVVALLNSTSSSLQDVDDLTSESRSGQSHSVRVRTLIVGGGIGGHAAAYELAKRGIGNSANRGPSGNRGVLVIEATNRKCGNIEDATFAESSGLQHPPGSPDYKPFRMGMHAMRINLASMPSMRCLANDLGLPLYFSPWHTEIHYSGRMSRNRRFNFQPEHNTCNGLDGPNPVYGNSSYDSSMLVAQTNGMLPGGYNLPTYNPASWAHDDDHNAETWPEDEMYGWYLGYPGYYNPTTGYDPSHPDDAYNGASTGPYNDSNPLQDHPRWTCSKYKDIYLLYTHYVGAEYANFMCIANVGFIGDCYTGTDPCFYIEWAYREYNTLDEGYPVGGMQELCTRMKHRTSTNFFGNNAVVSYSMNEPALDISSQPGSGSHDDDDHDHRPRYIVKTPTRRILADELLLNLSPIALSKITGNIARALNSDPHMKWGPRNVETSTLTVRWTASWWSNVTAPLWGSYRRIDSQSCTNRLEILNTPYHSNGAMHGMRAAYTDHTCLGNLHALEYVDNPSGANVDEDVGYPLDGAVATFIVRELRRIFPGYYVPAPIYVMIHFNPESWWFLRPGSPYSIAEIRDWAARPLGASEKVAMAHGAYNLIYSGWGYSAVNQTRVSLLKLIGAPHFTQAQYDDERSCHGRFVDDWTVEPGYSTPGLNTQYDYTNGMENEFFPPYFPGDAIAWVPPSSPHPPYQC